MEVGCLLNRNPLHLSDGNILVSNKSRHLGNCQRLPKFRLRSQHVYRDSIWRNDSILGKFPEWQAKNGHSDVASKLWHDAKNLTKQFTFYLPRNNCIFIEMQCYGFQCFLSLVCHKVRRLALQAGELINEIVYGKGVWT